MVNTNREFSTGGSGQQYIKNKALIQPPPIPPRTKPSLFLPTNSNKQTLLSKFLITSQTFSAKKAKANQQLYTTTNPFVFDTIQTDGLNPNASGDITLLPTKQPIDVSFEVDVTSNKKYFDLPKFYCQQPQAQLLTTNNITPTFKKLNKILKLFQDIVKKKLCPT